MSEDVPLTLGGDTIFAMLRGGLLEKSKARRAMEQLSSCLPTDQGLQTADELIGKYLTSIDAMILGMLVGHAVKQGADPAELGLALYAIACAVKDAKV